MSYVTCNVPEQIQHELNASLADRGLQVQHSLAVSYFLTSKTNDIIINKWMGVSLYDFLGKPRQQ